MTHVAAIVKTYDSATLRHVRRMLEAEALEMVDLQAATQAFVGKLELLTAVGAELDARGELLEPPPYIDTCLVDGARLSFQVRVF